MIYVMSDIHGNSRRFHSVLEQINLKPEDTLYILGDVVDRYPDGIKLLQEIMKMPNVKMLLGNHEYMMLNVMAEFKYDEVDWYVSNWADLRRLWFSNGGRVTYNALKLLTPEEYGEVHRFLKSLPIRFDIELNGVKYRMTHAAPTEDYEEYQLWYDSEVEYTVWKRWKKTDPTPEDYVLISGHTPTINYQEVNPLKIWYGNNMIDIDCGAGFPVDQASHRTYYYGRLACLRLDDMKEFYSEETSEKESDENEEADDSSRN